VTHWRQSNLDKLNAVDIDALRDQCRERAKAEDPEHYDGTYPRLVGSLSVVLDDAKRLANGLMEELQEKLAKLDALEWAAEFLLREDDYRTHDDRVSVYEHLYIATDIILKARKDGWTDDQLREHLKDGFRDDELDHERLIKQEERCEDCDDFCGEDRWCKLCAEDHEEVNAES
jgi:hypothetical protein